jgi:RimJ/RimL family protein N-acetyltransferase
MTIIIETIRLISRTWNKGDIEAYYAINQDPKVLEFLPRTLTREQVHDFIQAVNKHQKKYGYTLWAVALRETKKLIGFTGLNYTDWEAPFTPAVEIGWRLGSQYGSVASVKHSSKFLQNLIF